MIYEINLSGIIKPVLGATDEDKLLLTSLQSSIELTNSMSDNIVYLVDFDKCRIIYTSEYSFLIDAILGLKIQSIDEEAIKYAINEKEWDKIKSAFKIRELFLSQIPMENRKELIFHMDFCVKSKDGLFQTLHLRSVPLALTGKGFPWLEIHALTFSVCRDDGVLMLTHKSQQLCYIYNKSTESWNEVAIPHFSILEKHVLSLSSQGKNEQEIANLLYRSVSGIKKIKKAIFEKMGVTNIMEAIQMTKNLSIV